jgi:hypothetical protein
LIEQHRKGKNNYYALTQAGLALTKIADSGHSSPNTTAISRDPRSFPVLAFGVA